MKTIVLAFALIAVASAATLTDEQRKKAAEHVQACTKETGVPADTGAKLSKGDFSSKDEKVQCFAKCFLEKAGFMDNKGKLNDEVIIAKLSVANDEKKVKALLDQCKQEKGNTPCETAYKVYQCAYKNKAL